MRCFFFQTDGRNTKFLLSFEYLALCCSAKLVVCINSKKSKKKSKKRRKKSKKRKRSSSSSSTESSSSSDSGDEWVEKDVGGKAKRKEERDESKGPIIGPMIPESIQLGALGVKSDSKME